MKVFFVILLSCVFAESHEKKLTLAGTAPRLEKEFKYAFSSSASVKGMAKELERVLQNILKVHQFAFPKLVEEKYYLDPQFQSFVFKDYYFDSPDNVLGEKNISYRLRYRWVNLDRYHRYSLFPWLKSYYPDRCEIQLKENYKFFQDGLSEVEETRFEFRNESPPFNKKRDAPLPPWPKAKYLEVAKKGKFKNYRIHPYHRLQRLVGDKDLDTRFEVTTIRYRTHLNIKHPWGSGPNPEQAFIITIDKVYFKNSDDSKRGEFLELEIELERNTSTHIQLLTEGIEQSPKEVVELSRKADRALSLDLKFLQEELKKYFLSKLRVKKLPDSSKFQRMVKSEEN
jgi:hypothetical protein